MSNRTVHECRERGIPDSTITKAQAGKHLAASIRNGSSETNDNPGAIPVQLAVAIANNDGQGSVAGEIISYRNTTNCTIESGCAILQSAAPYTAAMNGYGVLPAAGGKVTPTAYGADTLDVTGTIVGGGTRMVDGSNVPVVFVRNLI